MNRAHASCADRCFRALEEMKHRLLAWLGKKRLLEGSVCGCTEETNNICISQYVYSN